MYEKNLDTIQKSGLYGFSQMAFSQPLFRGGPGFLVVWQIAATLSQPRPTFARVDFGVVFGSILGWKLDFRPSFAPVAQYNWTPPPKNVERDIYEYVDRKNKDTFFTTNLL